MKLPIHLPLEAILARGVLAPAAAIGAALIAVGASYAAARALWAARARIDGKLPAADETMVDLAEEERAEALFV